MTTTEVDMPLINEGIHAINFFNGRLLTAKDMTREQKARQDADSYLGKALGNGIACGFEITESGSSTISAPVLSVSPGLAVNRAGQLLKLGSTVDVNLIQPAATTSSQLEGFGRCAALVGGAYVAGPGVYMITIASACATRGRAQVNGLDSAGIRCNSDVIVETAQFRILWLNADGFGLSFPQQALKDESLFRNQLAAACLGFSALGADPFSTDIEDPVASLFGTALSEADVPLALIYWTSSGGLRFIDEWSVRRRLVSPCSYARETFTLDPVRAALGEARLSQFGAQLEDLLRPNPRPGDFRIEEYFRFIPPAACFPVTGAGSSNGFDPQQLLGALITGAADTLQTGMAASILAKSICFETLDLTQNNFVQIYEINENEQDVTAGNARQRYLLYVSCSLNGPSGGDGVGKAFADAWTVYRGLVKRRVFLPLGSTPEETAARISIVQSLRDVMDVSNREAARGAAWNLDASAALAAFDLLHLVQQDLVGLLDSNIPGTNGTNERKLFASTVNQYLNQSIPGSKPSLKNALAAAALGQAVQAQEAINKFVGTWSGEGVAIGPFGFKFDKSDNANLIPGASSSAQYFILSNGANLPLTMTLSAKATALTGDWSASTQILNALGGKEITEATLGSGASREIVVMLAAPADAEIGEAVTLVLTAEAGPPTSQTSTYTLANLLKVSRESGGSVEGYIQIAQYRLLDANNQVIQDPSNITPSSNFRLLVSVKYASSDAKPRDFDLILTVKNGDSSIWEFRNDETGEMLPSEQNSSFKLRISSVPADESPKVGRVRIKAPARSEAADRSVTLELSIQSVDLETQISDTYDPQITLTVMKS